MKKQVYTMKDVAKIAGVTQPTVSHVINGTASISKEVCKRVREAIEELNYRPNALAKGLKTNMTKTVGLIVPDISNSYYASLAKAGERLLTNNGYISFLSCTDYDGDNEQKLIELLLGYNVDGVIMMYQFANKNVCTQLTRSGVPFVAMDEVPSENVACSINSDSFYGGYLATQHLIEKGRTKIAYLSERLSSLSLAQRLDGYKKAQIDAGITPDESIIIVEKDAHDKVERGLMLGRKLNGKDIDAVFASTDVIAIGVLRALAEMKARVPKDVAVVGYDNIPMAAMSTPALTTVTQSVDMLAEIAVAELVRQMNGEKCRSEVLLKPELIVREST
ncbi:MAG: LacI family DNA-binding transcriptional regulator [Christensenellaceae bacterium]